MRTRRPALLLVLLALAAAGCGATAEEDAARPTLPAPLAESLAGRADAAAEHLAGGDPCAAAAEADALVDEVVAAVDAGQVPPELQEELLAGAQELAHRVECPAEAAEPPPAEEAPAEEAPEDVQTLVLGDAGEIDFRAVGDGLELVQVRPAPGWRHSVSADEDEVDVDLSRGNREISVAIDAEGGGRLTLDVDYQADRSGGAQTIHLGRAGEVALEVEGRTLRLLGVSLASGWQHEADEDEDSFDLDAQHEDGSEIALAVELAD